MESSGGCLFTPACPRCIPGPDCGCADPPDVPPGRVWSGLEGGCPHLPFAALSPHVIVLPPPGPLGGRWGDSPVYTCIITNILPMPALSAALVWPCSSMSSRLWRCSASTAPVPAHGSTSSGGCATACPMVPRSSAWQVGGKVHGSGAGRRVCGEAHGSTSSGGCVFACPTSPRCSA